MKTTTINNVNYEIIDVIYRNEKKMFSLRRINGSKLYLVIQFFDGSFSPVSRA